MKLLKPLNNADEELKPMYFKNLSKMNDLSKFKWDAHTSYKTLQKFQQNLTVYTLYFILYLTSSSMTHFVMFFRFFVFLHYLIFGFCFHTLMANLLGSKLTTSVNLSFELQTKKIQSQKVSALS